MTRILLIGLVGSIGALTRYEMSKAIHRRTARADMATMIVNLVGATALGFVVGTEPKVPLAPDMLTAVTVGFLGGFTTFSTWMVDVVSLAEQGGAGRIRAALNLATTLAGGIVGYGLARWLILLPA